MGANSLAIKFMVRDKKSIFYLILSTVICYLSLFTLFHTTYLNDGNSIDMMEKAVLGLTILVVAFISGYVSWYINIVSMEARRKEMAIQTVSGVTRLGILKIAFLQLFVISVISVVIALLLSFVTTPLLVRVIYGVLSLEKISFSISLEAIAVALVIIVLQFVFVFFYNGGMAYRNEAIDLFGKEKKLNFMQIPKSGIMAFVSLILYFLVFLGFLLPNISDTAENASAFSNSLENLSILGMIGILQFTIPLILDILISKKYKYNKKAIIVLKNLKSNLDNSLFLVVAFALVKFLTAVVLDKGSGEIQSTFALGIIGLIMIVIITSVALIYKVSFEAFKKKKVYKTMFMLGYKLDEIKSIIKIEIISFCALIISIPFFNMFISLLVKASFEDSFILNNIIFLMVYVLIGCLATGISYVVYNKIILEDIESREGSKWRKL